jgi:hypothetical protein
MVWQILGAVDPVACTRVDGWRYHPKHVEQFLYKTHGVKLYLDGYTMENLYDSRTREY